LIPLSPNDRQDWDNAHPGQALTSILPQDLDSATGHFAMTRLHGWLAATALVVLAAAALWPRPEDHAANAAAAPARGTAATQPRTPAASARRAAPRILEWEDLVPSSYRPEELLAEMGDIAGLEDTDPRAIALLAKLRKAYDEAPVVVALHGTYVRMPGYAIPLDQANGRTYSFLLVPFYGACIHEPPPPANQIVYVAVPAGTVIRNAFDVVWATGTMSARRTGTRLATAGYGIRADKVEPYRAEDDPNA
jgi:hypothetical protein